MSKTTKAILAKIPALLLAAAPIILFKIGSIILFGEPKIPTHLCKKD